MDYEEMEMWYEHGATGEAVHTWEKECARRRALRADGVVEIRVYDCRWMVLKALGCATLIVWWLL